MRMIIYGHKKVAEEIPEEEVQFCSVMFITKKGDRYKVSPEIATGQIKIEKDGMELNSIKIIPEDSKTVRIQ